MRWGMSTSKNLLSGRDALARRDSLEVAARRYFCFLPFVWVSFWLTWITGLAPSAGRGLPPRPGSEPRAFAFALLSILLGSAALCVPGVISTLGGMALLSGLRNFSSAVGHHMVHGAKVLPLSSKSRRLIYDLISATFFLSSFDDYKRDHQAHHAYVAGPDDADQQFIAWLGVSFRNPLRFGLTLLDPVFHARFAFARVRATLARGPIWRRGYALAAQVALAMLMPWTFYAVIIIAFQSATLLQWSTEHAWTRRPASGNAQQIALAVTHGRLLLPDVTQPGWLLTLAGYALFRILLLQGDLPQHVLHHIGKGPWAEAPYVYTALLLEGKVPLRQTGSIRAMFRLAFDSAVGVEPRPPRDMDLNDMLSM